MDRIRICHADSSGEFRKLFAQTAERCEGVILCGSTADGREAERIVRNARVDVLVTSLTLHFLDGMELISRIRRLAQGPRILVVTHLVRDFCIEEAMRLGADYFMLKPCTIPLVLERAKELALTGADVRCGAAMPGIAAPQPLIEALLCRMGVAPELSGFRYLSEAVNIVLMQGALSATKELYPQIALAHGLSACAVERAIRHAIDSAWKHIPSYARKQLFPGPYRPSNSRFILRIADACETSCEQSDWLQEL